MAASRTGLQDLSSAPSAHIKPKWSLRTAQKAAQGSVCCSLLLADTSVSDRGFGLPNLGKHQWWYPRMPEDSLALRCYEWIVGHRLKLYSQDCCGFFFCHRFLWQKPKCRFTSCPVPNCSHDWGRHQSLRTVFKGQLSVSFTHFLPSACRMEHFHLLLPEAFKCPPPLFFFQQKWWFTN